MPGPVARPRDEDLWTALAKVPETAWTPALDAKGKPRADAALAWITDLLDLTGWPGGLRVIVCREPVHPTYERELKPIEVKQGYRYQALATNTLGRQLQWLDARHRVHAYLIGRAGAPSSTAGAFHNRDR